MKRRKNQDLYLRSTLSVRRVSTDKNNCGGELDQMNLLMSYGGKTMREKKSVSCRKGNADDHS